MEKFTQSDKYSTNPLVNANEYKKTNQQNRTHEIVDYYGGSGSNHQHQPHHHHHHHQNQNQYQSNYSNKIENEQKTHNGIESNTNTNDMINQITESKNLHIDDIQVDISSKFENESSIEQQLKKAPLYKIDLTETETDFHNFQNINLDHEEPLKLSKKIFYIKEIKKIENSNTNFLINNNGNQRYAQQNSNKNLKIQSTEKLQNYFSNKDAKEVKKVNSGVVFKIDLAK
jgi:hypothetical protein